LQPANFSRDKQEWYWQFCQFSDFASFLIRGFASVWLAGLIQQVAGRQLGLTGNWTDKQHS